MIIESTAGISIDGLNDLIAENRVYEITIQDPNNRFQKKTYDIYELLSIKRAMATFLKGCPYNERSNPNIEKEIFVYIYTKLAYWAEYDDLAKEVIGYTPEFRQIYATDYLSAATGIDGVMIGRSGVCAGFAETLRNLLAEKGIEARFVSGWNKRDNGTGGRVGHAWNQVKLDGVWYNCDITCDRNFIKQGLIAPKFLKSNAEFSNYSKFPEGSTAGIENAEKSVSNQIQEVLVRIYRNQILEEMYPKEDDKKKKKKGFLKAISDKLKSIKGSERGNE